MEISTIKISKELLQVLIDSEAISLSDIEIVKTEIKDEFFNNDKTHKILKDKSNKAYKELKNYEWEKRYGK